MPSHTRLLCLGSRPDGPLETGDLVITNAPLPDLATGEVLVRNTWLSIDPSIRIRLKSTTPNGYLPPFEPGEPLVGLALGVVEDLRTATLRPGTSCRTCTDTAITQSSAPTAAPSAATGV